MHRSQRSEHRVTATAHVVDGHTSRDRDAEAGATRLPRPSNRLQKLQIFHDSLQNTSTVLLRFFAKDHVESKTRRNNDRIDAPSAAACLQSSIETHGGT